jgi:dTDP-4-dehydrorhamnose reductase
MKKTLLLTGGGGFVGANIIAQAPSGVALQAIDPYPVPLERKNLSWQRFDLRDSGTLQALFLSLDPRVVVHTAAISDIDYCQANQDLAEAVNVGVTRQLVELCRKTGAKLIFFSSDSVFNGQKGNYRETDKPDPVNFYARTKVEAEKMIEGSLQDWVIVRPSLILGLPILGQGNSFLWRMIQSLKKGQQVAFPKAEIRSPVDVITLSRAVLELAQGGYRGILHLSGNDTLSRFAMAQAIARALGYPVELVADTLPSLAIGRAPRPANVSLDNRKAKKVLKTPMMGFAEALRLIIENRGNHEL